MSQSPFDEPDITAGTVASSVEGTPEADDVRTSGDTSVATGNSRFAFLKTLTVYDAMLIASALSISLAVVLMLLELTSFGGIFFQWRTGEAYAEPVNPPS